MKKRPCSKPSGGLLIGIGLLGLLFHAFPGLLLAASVLVIVIGIILLP